MNFVEKLTAKAMQAALEQDFARGLLRCPNCGQKPSVAPVASDTLLRCEACGIDSLPLEWRSDQRGLATAHPDHIPAGTRIRRERMGAGECVWQIPASGKFGFFLPFGLLWTGITAVASGAFLFSAPGISQDSRPWFLYLFFAIFWAIGLGTLYAAIRNKYARHQVTVTRDLVTLRRELFGKVRQKSLITSQVSSVAQVEFYQQNYQPVYGVEIRGRDGKLRFGTTLHEAEKAWLVADIKRAVFGESGADPLVAPSPEMIAAQRQSSFSFPLPPAPKGRWLLGVFFILLGAGAITMGLMNGPDFPDHGGDATNWFTHVFSLVFGFFSFIPIMVGLAFGGVGLFMLRSLWTGRSMEIRLEGDETQVALRTYQHGRIIKEQSFSRSSVSAALATGTGHMNGMPMKRIDLIVDGRARPISRWTAGDLADSWVNDVCRALGSQATSVRN